MNFKSLISGGVLALLPMLSCASVLYEWDALNNKAPQGITLQLEFEQSTVQSGRFDFDLYGDGATNDGPHPGLGLIALNFSFPQPDLGVGFTRANGYGTGFYNYGTLSVHVEFEKGGFLTGYIRAGNIETGFEMRSQGRVFTVLHADTDGPSTGAGCGWTTNTPCAGATGQIRAAEVPEPGTIALLGGGLLAASRIRRRKAL